MSIDKQYIHSNINQQYHITKNDMLMKRNISNADNINSDATNNSKALDLLNSSKALFKKRFLEELKLLN